MKPFEIKKGIYWVGSIDWDLRNFHGYLTSRGSTYNAYLIVDEKIVLVDTVKHYCYEEMLERIRKVIDPAKIDYIVTNHVEMDHSGSLPFLKNICKNAVIIASPNGEKGLRKHYRENWDIKAVNTGDSINIGKRDLKFLLMQMVHWPDSMATYVSEEKLLLPNDAFGQHLASYERFDDELPLDIIKEEAAKYYANIVFPYGSHVNKALDAASSLEIDMIAPSHGIIWRRHLDDIIKLYRKWANNETEKKAVIVYATMWESTERIARAIYEAFERENISVKLLNLKTNDASDVMTHLLSAQYICVGSSTLNNGMLPPASAFLTYMKGLAPKNRVGLAFGSYGWGGQSIGEINDILAACGFKMLEPIKVQYVPDNDILKGITKKLEGEIS